MKRFMGLPKISLLEKASRKSDMDPKKSFIIGDKTVDIQTGKNAAWRALVPKSMLLVKRTWNES